MLAQLLRVTAAVQALGVMLFVLAYGRLPFQGESSLPILYAKYDMPPTRHPLLRGLIHNMLTVNPAQRPDILTVISQINAFRQAINSVPQGAGVTHGIPPAMPGQMVHQVAAVQPHAGSMAPPAGPSAVPHAAAPAAAPPPRPAPIAAPNTVGPAAAHLPQGTRAPAMQATTQLATQPAAQPAAQQPTRSAPSAPPQPLQGVSEQSPEWPVPTAPSMTPPVSPPKGAYPSIPAARPQSGGQVVAPLYPKVPPALPIRPSVAPVSTPSRPPARPVPAVPQSSQLNPAHSQPAAAASQHAPHHVRAHSDVPPSAAVKAPPPGPARHSESSLLRPQGSNEANDRPLLPDRGVEGATAHRSEPLAGAKPGHRRGRSGSTMPNVDQPISMSKGLQGHLSYLQQHSQQQPAAPHSGRAAGSTAIGRTATCELLRLNA